MGMASRVQCPPDTPGQLHAWIQRRCDTMHRPMQAQHGQEVAKKTHPLVEEQSFQERESQFQGLGPWWVDLLQWSATYP